MESEIVSNWFGEAFSTLAPELQELHRHGGVLQGDVQVCLGSGIAGMIGKRLTSKLNIPEPGTNHLQVNISHDQHVLHWDRQFNQSVVMQSNFKPVGTLGDGYWVEKTGPLELNLTVDVKNHGWHWRCLSYKYRGVPIPSWIFPKMNAYKHIEDGGYKFFVGFEAPLIGTLFSYSGTLTMASQCCH